eukprot:7182680-Prymnesium_polylepis.1
MPVSTARPDDSMLPEALKPVAQGLEQLVDYGARRLGVDPSPPPHSRHPPPPPLLSPTQACASHSQCPPAPSLLSLAGLLTVGKRAPPQRPESSQQRPAGASLPHRPAGAAKIDELDRKLSGTLADQSQRTE